LGCVGLKWILYVESEHVIKTSRSHYKILSKLTQICWRSLSMTDSYSVQNSVARPTRELHVKSRILELKSRVHTIIFYRNWPKFIGDDSVWLTATLCKVVWLTYTWVPCQEPNPEIKTPRSHYKILLKLTEICWKWVWLIATVQSRVARPTRGPHVKSWTMKLKSRIRTIKFNQNWLKFFEMTQYNRQLLCAK